MAALMAPMVCQAGYDTRCTGMARPYGAPGVSPGGPPGDAPRPIQTSGRRFDQNSRSCAAILPTSGSLSRQPPGPNGRPLEGVHQIPAELV